MEGIRFYSGVGEMDHNHHPVYTGGYACIAPVYGATLRTKRVNRIQVPHGIEIIQDSGAFPDGPGQRLSFAGAYERQVNHAERFHYTGDIKARASYDCLLIDEIWENGIRRKERWPEEAGEFAVKTSVDAASFIIHHRDNLPLILSAQGVSPSQYLRCARQIVPLMDASQDIFGLGGWCIIGKMPSRMMPIFREAMSQVIPFLGSAGVRRIHIWGVCYAPALGELLYLCDEHNIVLSTDSMGASLRPTKGEWGYASWRDSRYQRPPILPSCKHTNSLGEKDPSCPIGTRCRGLERARHIAAVREWLTHFRTREPALYRPIPLPRKKTYVQMPLFNDIGA